MRNPLRPIYLLTITLFAAIALLLAAGCAPRPSLLPNSNPALRKTNAQFAADASKRSYPTTAPSGGEAVARAQVGYNLNRLDVVNLSTSDWDNVEIWVNQKYVVFIPKMRPSDLQALDFKMLCDKTGKYLDTKDLKEKVDQVEAYMGGKKYEIPVRLSD